jgi:hypothetical protein
VPTSIGSYWIYAGSISEASSRPNELNRKLTKKIVKIVDSISADNFSAALAFDHVEEQDIRDNRITAEPDSYEVWMIFDNSRYYEYRSGYSDTSGNRLDIWRSLKSEISCGRKPEEPSNASWQIEVPSHIGDGVPENYSRPDTWYCWCTENRRQIKAGSEVARYHISQNETEYTVAYRSCPGDEFRRFTTGIGITGSSYTHHGTPTNWEEHLIEFHPASAFGEQR